MKNKYLSLFTNDEYHKKATQKMNLNKLDNSINTMQNNLEKTKEECLFVEKNQKNLNERIKLNIGGQKYETSRTTILQYPESVLSILISDRHNIKYDDNKYIFIDRDGHIFKIILNSMRYGKIILPNNFEDYELLANEINYYKLPFEVEKIQMNIPDLTRKEIVRIIRGNHKFNFGGMKLCNTNLSGLVFSECHATSGCDFSGSNLSDCKITGNLSHSKFNNCVLNTKMKLDSVDISNTEWSNIDFSMVEISSNACFMGSIFRNCNFANCDVSSKNKWNKRTNKLPNNLFKKIMEDKLVELENGLIIKEKFFINCIFYNCNMTKCNFSNNIFTRAEFYNCLCDDTNFSYCNMANTKRVNTEFKNANLTGALNLALV